MRPVVPTMQAMPCPSASMTFFSTASGWVKSIIASTPLGSKMSPRSMPTNFVPGPLEPRTELAPDLAAGTEERHLHAADLLARTGLIAPAAA